MNIKIHSSTYVFLLISFLAGYFEYIFLLLLIIFTHESGHYIFSKIININPKEIIIYPFGGITIYEVDLNIKISKELIILLGGIIFQLIFLLLIINLYYYGYITYRVFSVIKRINYILISFNFLPILPLDGGRLLNLILDKVFCYKISNIITIIISFLFIILFIFIDISVFRILLGLFLIKSIYIEISNIDFKYNKFLIERYINNYSFKKTIRINNIKRFKRDYYHIINGVKEHDFLNKLFDRGL